MKKSRQDFYFILFLGIFLLTNYIALAQPGQLDSTFNGTGISYQSTSWTIASGAIFQPDGKLLIAGFGYKDSFVYDEDGVIVRYKKNGTPDSSFGINGRMFTDFGGITDRYYSVTLQQDGKIIASGDKRPYGNPQKAIAARYTAEGILDSSFGDNGKINTDYDPAPFSVETIYKTETLENGAILVTAGMADTADKKLRPLRAMYHSNGILDYSFGVNGILKDSTIDFPVATDPLGRKIYLGINRMNDLDYPEITRRLPNGEMDPSFNGTGKTFTFIDSLGASLYTCVVQSDKKILVGGSVNKKSCDRSDCSGHDFLLVRYNDNGLMDSSFGNYGIVRLALDNGNDMEVLQLQSDGKIIFSGTTYNSPASFAEGNLTVVRMLSDGRIDSTFGDAGKKIFNTPSYSDGRLTGMLLKNHRIYLYGVVNDNTIPFRSSRGIIVYVIKNDYSHPNITRFQLCQGISQVTLVSDIDGTSYQWQQSANGVNFADITNNNEYTGAGSSALLLKSMNTSMNGYQYRCITNNDTSSIFTIHFVNAWTGAVSNNWEETANWTCGVLPDDQTDVIIYNSTVKINSEVVIKSLTLKLGATISVSAGYSVTITGQASTTQAGL